MIQTKSYLLNASLDLSYAYEFRGAFLDMIRKNGFTADELELFTNKKNLADGNLKLIERYAPIQCRCENGLASIWGIYLPNTGAESLNTLEILEKVMTSGVLKYFNINNQNLPLQIIDSIEKKFDDLTAQEVLTYEYLLYHFVPFNEVKIKEYEEAPSLVSKIQVIERIILNELVLFGYLFNNKYRISVEIVNIYSTKGVIFKTRKGDKKIQKVETSFFLKFKSNIKLPDGISIGRHKAYGYGVIKCV